MGGINTGQATGAELHGLFREVFHLQAVLSEIMDLVHDKAGLRTSHKRVANVIQALGAATVPDVAASLHVSRQFVQTVSNELEAQGMLSFQDNPRHKRSRLVVLTDRGHEVLRRSQHLEAQIIQEELPKVGSAEVEQAALLLKTLRKAVHERIQSLE
ncbi:MAG: MarR family transcriptional regulator [Desulfovibrio sp.]|nr:MAG: MarR family transcriptional regulator [Desulfovibrio sp.]